MYLGVLCDELQKWDRFPAGERYLRDLKSFEEYCTDSERIKLTAEWQGQIRNSLSGFRLAGRAEIWGSGLSQE